MKNHIKKLKSQKKALVTIIKATGNDSARYLFRHIHIAECLIRGRTMEQIENTNRENNKPDSSIYSCFMEEKDVPEIPSMWLSRYYERVFCEVADESA